MTSWLTRDFEKTFYDSQSLYYTDVTKLIGPTWLNDSIINYYLLHMENGKYADKKDDYLFIGPNITFWVKQVQSKDDVADAVNPLNPLSKRLIFIPINDNDDETGMEAEGGSHWSLVMYDRATGQFNYYDASGDSNYRAALKTTAKIAHFLDSSIPYNDPKAIKLHSRKAPQQQNGYDCGMYMLAYSDALAQAGANDEKALDKITPSFVTNMRKEILELIHKGVGAE